MKILVVDDLESNRKLLRVWFEAEGHTTIEAADGVAALQILARENVDAVLTDLLMPRMDGYRLCHEIRMSEPLHDMPVVIYTSTYTSRSDEKLAFRLGADKYLMKPAPFKDILASVLEAIAMPQTRPRPPEWREVEVLKEYSDQLVKKLEQRNVELAEANRRLTLLDDAKNDCLRVIAHELRTPLVGIFGVAELVLAGGSAAHNRSELSTIFHRSRQRLMSIIEDALLLTEIDGNGGQFHSGPVSLDTAMAAGMAAAAEFAASRRVHFAGSPSNLGMVVGDPALLARALRSLLETAVKFTTSGRTVRLTHDIVADTTRVIIDGDGLAIPDSAAAKFFEIFAVGETLTPGADLGLGPAVAYRILALFGGSASVAARDPAGIRLTISLKHAAPNSMAMSSLHDALSA
jgi:CheY-like chemotaxis protein